MDRQLSCGVGMTEGSRGRMSESAGGKKDGRVCGQCGQIPTFCGSSRMQAEGEGAESNSISSKRAVGDREGDQKRGWDRNASLGAPGCCPAVPIAGGPFSGFELWDLLPKTKSSSQSSSCGGPPE